MNRKIYGVLAIVLIALMALVATAGLDNLPRNLKRSVDAAKTRVIADHTLFDQDKNAIERALRDEPALFRTRADSWQGKIRQAQARIVEAEAELATLQKLAQEDRRQETAKVEQGLARVESLRASGVQDLKAIRADVDRWLGYKRNLPARLAAMTSDYESIRSFDPEAAAASARKAMVDWPAKRADLEQRLNGITEMKARAEKAWDASAAMRSQAETNNPEAIDYAAVFDSADNLQQLAQQGRAGAEAINQLAGQLYVNWDKLLLEVDDNKQKVRIVRTRFNDATLQNGQSSQEEKWEPTTPSQAEHADRNVGMVILRKPAGKFDSEAESTIQAPAYAYVAPPGQANSYGSWNNGVWSWLPQYMLLSQMLRGPSIPPITMGDYNSYNRARQRGDVYYGGNTRTWGRGLRGVIDRVRSSGSSGGGFWREREAARVPSGFRGSRYQNRGTFSGSRYQSRPGGGFRSYSRGMGGFRGGRR